MLRYIEREPIQGDIVECLKSSLSYTKGLLYKCKHIVNETSINGTLITEIDNTNNRSNGKHIKYFKPIFTEPLDNVRIFDKVYNPSNNCVYTVIKINHSTVVCRPIIDNPPLLSLTIDRDDLVIVERSTAKLAYYKRSGLHWTPEELSLIPNISSFLVISRVGYYRKWCFNRNINNSECYYMWAEQEEQPDFNTLLQVAYEDAFPEIETQTSPIKIDLVYENTLTLPNGSILLHYDVSKELINTIEQQYESSPAKATELYKNYKSVMLSELCKFKVNTIYSTKVDETEVTFKVTNIKLITRCNGVSEKDRKILNNIIEHSLISEITENFRIIIETEPI